MCCKLNSGRRSKRHSYRRPRCYVIGLSHKHVSIICKEKSIKVTTFWEESFLFSTIFRRLQSTTERQLLRLNVFSMILYMICLLHSCTRLGLCMRIGLLYVSSNLSQSLLFIILNRRDQWPFVSI